jgi:hypothetical protein
MCQERSPSPWWGRACGSLLFLLSAALMVALFVAAVRAVLSLWK